MKKILILLATLCVPIYGDYRENNQVDLLIFSYNRPLQLYALLESTHNLITGLHGITVIYRASDDAYNQAYQTVNEDFPQVHFVRQSLEPHKDFKPLTMQALGEHQSSYILFAVDDIVVTSKIDLSECVQALEKSNAYAFYLRLGKNITVHYQSGKQCPLPPLSLVMPGVYSWHFGHALKMWNYPNTVDMTLYRTSEIVPLFEQLSFSNPNELEDRWSAQAWRSKGKIGICYAHSAIVNIPLNCVQTIFMNKHMDLLSTEHLLAAFNDNAKIDLGPLCNFDNCSAHADYVPTFIARS